MTASFAVCLCCIDGRIHVPLVVWTRDNYAVDFVDLVTEPGMDGLLAESGSIAPEIIAKLDFCLEKHQAQPVLVAGHHDCLGNPVDEAAHRRHIVSSVGRLRELRPGRPVAGLWVSATGDVERITP